MSTLAPLSSLRTTEFPDRPLAVLIRVPRLDHAFPSGRAVQNRRRLRREVRWAAQAVAAVGLFTLGLAIGRPDAGHAASTSPASSALAGAAPPIAAAVESEAGPLSPARVVLKGILPDDEAENGRHAGR